MVAGHLGPVPIEELLSLAPAAGAILVALRAGFRLRTPDGARR